MIRSAGVLLPVFSLANDQAVGTMGREAREWIDYLADAGMTYWQVLPVGPTGFSNSPYQPLSSFAGNLYLIDLHQLVAEGYLEEKDLEPLQEAEPEKVDYGFLYKVKRPILKKAAEKLALIQPDDYFAFLREEGWWLKDYAVFMAIKDEQKGKPWQQWPDALKHHDSPEVQEKTAELGADIVLFERIQYFFNRQMKALHQYAEKRGIQIIGDLPFYLGEDSIDIWSHPEQFDLNGNNEAVRIAGVPGQKWGNPLFNWERMKQDDYRWWCRRAAFQYRWCDVLRLDHFRGFMQYYAIPKDSEDGQSEWHNGPGNEILKAFERQYGWKQMILEDLGDMTPDFIQMVKDSGFPGMKILQYAFDPNDPGSIYMPFQYDSRRAAVYTGTHDNNTLKGWIKAEPKRAERAAAYLGTDLKHLDQAMIRCAYGTTCDLAVVQAQDLLGLGEEARMNEPGAAHAQWTWRMKKGAFTEKMAAESADELKLYCRYNWEADRKKEALLQQEEA
jgi:4-alpha-glucanotransferase